MARVEYGSAVVVSLGRTRHAATIDGHPVRFFSPPLGGADMPWPALSDLVGTVGLPDWWREQAVSG